MALEKSRRSAVPTDAIIISEKEAFEYQRKILDKWNVTSDVAGYKYSSLFLGVSSFTGIYLNTFYRRKFRLLDYAKITSYLPLTVIPGMVSVLLHHEFVLNDIILQKEKCPICLEMRGAAIQMATGFLLPLVITPISTLSLVHRYYTYDIPYVSKEPIKLLRLVVEKTKPIKRVLFWMMIGHAFLGNAVTYLEMDSVSRVNQKLSLLEKLETES